MTDKVFRTFLTGTDVRVVVTYTIKGTDPPQKTDPDATPTLEVLLNGVALAAFIPPVTMNKLEVGKFDFFWDSSAEAEEQYEAIVRAAFNTHDSPVAGTIELHD